MTDHLSREQLLRYADGELSKSSMADAAEHLQSCWACRAELDRLEAHIASILDAQNQVFSPSLPSPPKPWPRLEPRLHAIAEKSNGTSLWRRITPLAEKALRLPIAFATAALVGVLIVSLVWLPVMPVSAKEVLHRVEVADAKRFAITPQQVIRQRIRVRKKERRSSGERTTKFESWTSSRSAYWNSEKDSVSSELLDRYKTFGIASALPISPVVLEAWGNLAGSEPSASPDRDGTIEVQFAANSEGRARGLEEVSFHVQSRDWHVDEMRLSFVDAVFEITEEDVAIVDRREVPGDVLALLEPPAGEPVASVSSPKMPLPSLPRSRPRVANLDDVEVGVRYDLHRIGADLGENIEVSTRPPGQVIVNAWGISPERKAHLVALLEDKPSVRLELKPPEDRSNVLRHIGPRVVVIPRAPAPKQMRDDRLAKFFGSAETEENYTREVLKISTDMLSHLYALRSLASRWPSDKDSHLSPNAKAQLSAMVHDHARELRSEVDKLKAELNPLLSTLGYEIEFDTPDGAAPGWQDSSTSGLDAAKRTDHVLRSLLTTSDNPASLEDALPKLRQGVKELDRVARALLAPAA